MYASSIQRDESFIRKSGKIQTIADAQLGDITVRIKVLEERREYLS